MKLPAEIDDLMWEVAEADTPELMDDFAARYPEHKSELLKRIKMVRQLKGARPKQKPRAAFRPRPVPPPFRVSLSPLWAAAGAFCFLVVGVLAGVGVTSLLSKSGENLQASRLKSNPEDGTSLERSTWIPNPPPQQPSADTGSNSTPNDPPQPEPERVPPVDSRITVINEGIRLSRVLNEVAVKAGIRIQAAPGMPEVDVAVEYHDLPAMAVLSDLGRTCGFTPLRQTDNEVLLIPTVDRENPPKGVLGGSVEVDGGAEEGENGLPGTSSLSGRIGR